MPAPSVTFAADLRVARIRLGLTQEALAHALGVARNTVARWERGEIGARHERLIRRELERLLMEATSP